MIKNSNKINNFVKNKKLTKTTHLSSKRLKTITNLPFKKSTKITNLPFKKTKQFLRLRLFKRTFIFRKKTTFFKRLQTYFNEARLVWRQFSKYYLKKNQRVLIKYKTKVGHQRFFYFLQKLELRLSTILIRSRFFYKLSNACNAIKLGFILINGIVIKKVNYMVNVLDLFQKRRTLLSENFFNKRQQRLDRLVWRHYRWKKARFIFWQVRRASDLNMYHIKKESCMINYLEINYKIPAGIILRNPFFKELVWKKQPGVLKPRILQKIYFVF